MKFRFGQSKGGIDSREIHDETINRWRAFSGGGRSLETTEADGPATNQVTLTDVVTSHYVPQWPDSSSESAVIDAHSLNLDEPLIRPEILDTPRAGQGLHLVEKKPVTGSSDVSLSVDQDLRRRFGGNVRSALGPGTVIEGKFSFDGPVRVDGTLTGEINSSSALIVGEQAQINGNISVGSLIILGVVVGPVHASELIEIKSGGQLDGNIVTARLIIEDGGRFNGTCNHHHN